jgi:transposase InsO family protein
MDHIVRLHGILKTIISDRGTQFIARFWEQLHECLGTKLTRSSSYHPQTDGQTERINQIFEDICKQASCTLTRVGTSVCPWQNSPTTIVIKPV